MVANNTIPVGTHFPSGATSNRIAQGSVNGTAGTATSTVAAAVAGKQIAVMSIVFSAANTAKSTAILKSAADQIFPEWQGAPGDTLHAAVGNGQTPLCLCATGEDLNITETGSKTQYTIVYRYV